MTPLLPTPRVQEVLSVIGGLPAVEARAVLHDAVLQFDTAELDVLRTQLPAHTAQYLPGDAVANGPTTQEIVAATFGPSPWKPWFVAGAAVLLTIATVALAWPRAAHEPIALAAPVSTPVVVVPAPLPPPAVKPAPTRAEKTAKKAAKKQPARERR